MPPLEGSLAEVPLLTAAEAERAWGTVHELSEQWIRRDPRLPFFTLGAASYLDAVNGRFASYQELARSTGPVLREHFGWLLDKVADAVSEEVGKPAVFCARLALPGFHVFLADPAFAADAASIHYDLQYQGIDWSDVGAVDTADQRSLTLSVRLPAAGAGLRIWDIDARDMAGLSAEEQAERRAARARPRTIAYRVGTLVIHSGHHLHQIAPMTDQRPGDERVTLQGHAVSGPDRWVIYW